MFHGLCFLTALLIQDEMRASTPRMEPRALAYSYIDFRALAFWFGLVFGFGWMGANSGRGGWSKWGKRKMVE
jgi:hypothetical protein